MWRLCGSLCTITWSDWFIRLCLYWNPVFLLWLMCFFLQTHSDTEKKITCKSFLESFDSIQVVAQLISFVENIWKSSFCDSKFKKFRSDIVSNRSMIFCVDCFAEYNDINGTVTYTLANITKTFIQKKIQFDLCIFNATGVCVNFLWDIRVNDDWILAYDSDHSHWFECYIECKCMYFMFNSISWNQWFLLANYSRK